MTKPRNKKPTYEQPDPHLVRVAHSYLPRKRSLMEIVVVGLIKWLEKGGKK